MAEIVTISPNWCATGERLIEEGEPCVRGRELEKGAFPSGG
jgi:hypothetical protein